MTTSWVGHTSCQMFDAALGGGIRSDQLTEICGESGIGKSQLCMQSLLCILHDLKNQGVTKTVVYLVVALPFPPHRLRQLLHRFVPGDDDSTLVNVLVRNVGSEFELPDILTQLSVFLKSKSPDSPSKLAVILLDSISVFFSRYTSSRAELEETMERIKSVGYALKRMANEHNLVLLVCNSAVNGTDPNSEMNFITSGRTMKPAIGKCWDKYVVSRVVLAWEWNHEGTSWERTMVKAKGDQSQLIKYRFEIGHTGLDGHPL